MTPNHPFKPVPLTRDQLEYGLVKRDGPSPPDSWEPVPWNPIAGLALEPEELEARFGPLFEETFDQLGPFRLAVLDLPSGRRVAFYRHRYQPGPGMQLYILPQQFTRSTEGGILFDLGRAVTDAVVKEVLDTLGLSPERLSWRRPRVAREGLSIRPNWPAIAPTRPTPHPYDATFTRGDVRRYLAANPPIPTLKAAGPVTVETVEILSGDQIGGFLANARERFGKQVICHVTLRDAFVDEPPPALGPASSCPVVHLIFDGKTGLLVWAFTEPEWLAKPLDNAGHS